jgi:DNA polymerase IV
VNRTILHSDCNCFYASVELLHHPELRGKPVVVGGDPEARHGIVLTADYTAKRYGVKTGMALWQAKQVCPDITFLPPRMDLYLRFSRMAQEISSRMKKELGITVSAGVSFNKIFAKLGSDYKKPDAITTMYEDEFQRKAWCLPVSDLLYVGNATNKKLYSMGIRTIGDLAKSDETLLVRKLGKMGSILWAFANGYDESPVKLENTSAPVKSVGNSTTTPRDMETDEDVKIVLYILAESVAARLRENGFRCRTVEISVRDKELFHFSKQVKLQNASNITKEIAEAGYRLYKDNYRLPADDKELKSSRPEFFQKPLRSIGIRATDLVTDYFWEQLDMFMDPQAREKQMKMDETVDIIRKRFGFYSVQRGLMYRDRILSACDAKSDHTVHPHGYFG